jgi:hypothetical protein
MSLYLRYAYLVISLLLFSKALSNSLLALSEFCFSMLIYLSKVLFFSCNFLFSSVTSFAKFGFLDNSSLALDTLLSKSV